MKEQNQMIFITIGEAPRMDISASFDLYFHDQVHVRQVGLLNGLTFNQAKEQLGSTKGETVISTFCDGTSLVMSKAKVEKALQEKINILEMKEKPQAIIILCTADFQQLTTQTCPLIEPEKVLLPFLHQKFGGKLLGVLLPLEDQIVAAQKKWSEQQLHPFFAAASPYDFKEKQFLAAGKKLKEQGATALILDCMGYSQRMKDFLEKTTDLPVYQSNELLFEYVNDRFGQNEEDTRC